jgi:hypothetical protein
LVRDLRGSIDERTHRGYAHAIGQLCDYLHYSLVNVAHPLDKSTPNLAGDLVVGSTATGLEFLEKIS